MTGDDGRRTDRLGFGQRIKAQRRRRRAYAEGVYELHDDEGFICYECGWRGLTAPVGDLDDPGKPPEKLTVCPECDNWVELAGDHSKDEYLIQFLGGDSP